MTAASTGVAGFPRESVTFFARLAKHNDREWFHAHRDVVGRSELHRLARMLGGARC